jgi:phage tail P2-like protein
MSDTLLPPNATPQEAAIDLASARIGDVPVPLDRLWNPLTCPESALPWLAWALSVDEWDAGWPEDRRRATIAQAVFVHRRKGTLASVRAALSAAGLGTATITENFGRKFYDGMHSHDGSIDHAEADHWAEYRVFLDRPVSIAQAATVRRLLAATAPLRNRLKVLDYQAVAHLYDGTLRHDGVYSHGAS